MKLRAAAALLVPLCLAVTAHASSDASPTPGLLDRTMILLHLKHARKPANMGQLHDGMELKVDISPMPIQLSQDRELQVVFTIYNRTRQFIHLNFPTSQRIEILVLDSSGKTVETWSEDQSFTDDPATVTINPGERIEYTESVPTREMSAGEPCLIDVSFPSYPDLKIEQRVIPQK
ncbi:MAG: BsuPI-related putative proteinase inhibitor [Chthoniobacteraceae bacterium]|jgi:hypothetical protein